MSLFRAATRAMTGVPYIMLGYDAATEPGGRVGQAAPLLDQARAVVPIPLDNETIVRANGAAMAVGGAMIASGVGARAGAGLIAASLVPTTAAGHPFWKIDDPMQRKMQKVQFLKNVSLLGGLLIIAAGAGKR
ncbi:DoxX family protein [Gordonia sp. (in: high G+C Gram-positive bacteria)]|uniref:DoxX family protein n=1 Tax=Gordonia sp. (in: high G+C Gram-positive bacteria) TaxID=84139 RepID=UPI003C7963A3